MDDAALIQEVERLIIDYSDAWEGYIEDTTDLGDVIGRWNGYSGFASRCRFDSGEVEARLDEVIQALEGAGRQYTWVIGPSSTPDDLPDRFTARGFKPAFEWDGLVLEDLATPFPSNPDVRVEDLTEDNAEGFADFIVGWIGENLERSSPLARASRYLAIQPKQAHIYLARIEDRIAGYAVLRIEPNGTAYLRQGATLPAFRQRGIYLTMVGHRLAVARASGCTVAVVQAISRSSAPILRKRGFRRVCGLTAFARPSRDSVASEHAPSTG